MNLEEKTLSSQVVFDGRVIRVEHDEVELPGGARARREVVRHCGGVCAAAVNSRGEVAVVRQFRYPYAEVIAELPAGKLNPGEDPLDAMKRELLEEVGAVGFDWRDMGKLYPSPGYCAEVIHLYACRVDGVGEPCPDEDEFLEAEFVPLERLKEQVMSGEIRDAKTQTLVLKLAAEIII
ncbi:MAG: NUDIX hydrolase [Oscillospiraceae bacterium]|nr:NUDIX hydrolase [Oscillospiraceae bacterium]